MSATKHKIFKVKIYDSEKFKLDTAAQTAINKFLAESNNVYVNHSTSILTEDIEEYDSVKTLNRFLVISLVYKDLEGTPMSLTKVSKRTKAVIEKEIEAGEKITEPSLKTEFEKTIHKKTKSIKDKVEITEEIKLNLEEIKSALKQQSNKK